MNFPTVIHLFHIIHVFLSGLGYVEWDERNNETVMGCMYKCMNWNICVCVCVCVCHLL